MNETGRSIEKISDDGLSQEVNGHGSKQEINGSASLQRQFVHDDQHLPQSSSSSSSEKSSLVSSLSPKEWSNWNGGKDRSLSDDEANGSHEWLRSGIRTVPIQVISTNKVVPNVDSNPVTRAPLSSMLEEEIFHSEEVEAEEDEEDGLWQDETDSEMEDLDHSDLPLPADRSTPNDQQRTIKPERGKDVTSYKEALRQYKRSRRALLRSENGLNYESERDPDSENSRGEQIDRQRGKENDMTLLKEPNWSGAKAALSSTQSGRLREKEASPQPNSAPDHPNSNRSLRHPSQHESRRNSQSRILNSTSSDSKSNPKHPATSRSDSDQDIDVIDFASLSGRRPSNSPHESRANPSAPELLYASVPGTPEVEDTDAFAEPTLISPLFSSSRRASEQSSSKSSADDHTRRKHDNISDSTANGLLSPNPSGLSSQETGSSPKRDTNTSDLSIVQTAKTIPSHLRRSSSKDLPKTPSTKGDLGQHTPEAGVEKPEDSSDPHQTTATKQIQTPNVTETITSRRVSDPGTLGSSRRAEEKEPERGLAAGAVHSLWDYLREEILATDFDSTQELKWERVTNFMAIPFWMEKIMIFGFAVCLDSFLYTFTILPLRFAVALYSWISNTFGWLLRGQKKHLHSSHKCDILKTLLIIFACFILSKITDTSKMYHSVRGQDVVKLYVIFNVLEIADRLCCSFGQDLLDSLFSRITLARRKDGSQPYLRPLGFFLLSLAYILAHTLVLLYQLVTLNVAINSYDNALLTLLLSNQFVEIKGSVFKKFEKENLFQLTCADIVERFQLTLMLSCIGLRNLIEVSGGSSSSDEGGIKVTSSGPLPTSFTVFPSLTLIETIISPVLIVLLSECIVDWLKHAFITKFNHIRPSIYGRFMDVLCRDLVIAGPGRKEQARKHTFVDQSPIVSRRLGFAALPLACLLVRVSSQIFNMLADTSHFDECAMPGAHELRGGLGFAKITARGLGQEDNGFLLWILELTWRGAAWALTVLIAWVSLIAIKLLLGTNLVSYASHRYATMQKREEEEVLNARNRMPIGVDKEELDYDIKLKELVDKRDDDASRINLQGQQVSRDPNGPRKGGGSGGGIGSLTDVSRYQMIKSRIW